MPSILPAYTRVLKIAFFACTLVPVVVVASSQYLVQAGLAHAPSESWGFGVGSAPAWSWFELAALAVVTLGLNQLAWRALRRSGGGIEREAREQFQAAATLPEARIDLAIAASAGLGLFLELAVIRWQATVFEIFSFYKNIGLLACFAGLGLGYALASRERIPLLLVAPLLAVQAVFLIALRNGLPLALLESIRNIPVTEQLEMGLGKSTGLAVRGPALLFVSAVFLLTVITFVPIGQLCGRLMQRRPRLRAYGLNLIGSLAGVLLMLGISYLWTPPVVWFAIAFLALLAFQSHSRTALVAGGASALIASIILAWPVSFGSETVYSPYQVLEREKGDAGRSSIQAAGTYYQRVHDLGRDNANVAGDPRLQQIARYYELPYRFHGRPERVCVVGAGTGNDVAAALRMEAGHVAAIEIDPAIVAWGRLYHPEDPYGDPRVEVVVGDARWWIRTTEDTYDVITFGLLDSHTLLSHASNIRLDSYVYTVEALREARSRLRDGGILCLSFSVITPELGRKIYLMLEQAFDGRPPICLRSVYDGGITFLQSGDGVPAGQANALEGFDVWTSFFADPSIAADVSTDDWPFLYMPVRVYPFSYLLVLGWLLVLSVLLIGSFLRQRPRFGHAAFFLLGAGFMLVETKGITELGLAFGNTWQVVGIVISGILLMAFLANLAVDRLGLRRPLVPFLLLLGSLVLGVLTARAGGFQPTATGRLATVAVLTCPVFFSGLVFSTILQRADDVAGAMAANLMGAMCGGLLEYNSMYFGFHFLYWLAIAVYGLAMLATLLRRGPATTT